MTPQVSDYIPGLLEDTDKYIEVADGHYIMAKKKGQIQIIMCNDNGYPFITALHNILLSLDICNKVFSIVTLMNLGHTCFFQKRILTVYFGDKKKNAVTLPHSA